MGHAGQPAGYPPRPEPGSPHSPRASRASRRARYLTRIWPAGYA